MKQCLSIFVILMLLAGCGSTPIPDWTNAAFNQLDNYKKTSLIGNVNAAELHFNKALEEIKKSGDLDILARVYLIKYAIQTSLLEKIDDREYLRIEALYPSPVNKTYHAFLKADFDHVEPNLLPEQYRVFFKVLRTGNPGDTIDEILKMEDPLSRLIATGLMIQYSNPDERCLQAAVDTASQNGWKKALMIYLNKLHSFYETKKDSAKALNTQKKLELIRN